MADRDVDYMGVAPLKNITHERHKIVESIDRNEVLLKHVR
jgi:hypothetical protein